MNKVNLFSCELGEHDEHGSIANRGTRLGPMLGAERIGAGLYEIDSGRWVWPYHYHHGVEEWLYVVSGSPTLRHPRGERALSAGDFAVFPSGHEGAHTVAGPGRVVVFSLGGWPRASVCVYPDSDKVGARPGDTGVPGLDDLDFRRTDAVDYWYGEGSDAPVQAPELVRPPESGYRPVYNLAEMEVEASDMEQPDGFQRRVRRLGRPAGAERLEAVLFELDPGQGTAPYHCEHGREDWLLILSGTPTLRHPAGEDRLGPGDVVCLPDGPAGARRVTNLAAEVTRAVLFSSGEIPSVREYLDKRTMMVRYSRDHDAAVFMVSDFWYWEGGLV